MRVHEIDLEGYSATWQETGGKSGPELATWGSFGLERLHLNFGDGWEGMTVTATFLIEDQEKTMLVDAEGMVDVPPQAMAQPGSGVVVFSGDAEKVQRITADIRYKIKDHSEIRGDTPGIPEDTFHQFIEEVGTYRKEAVDAAKEADSAKKSAEESASTAADEADLAEESAKSAAYSASQAKRDALDARTSAADAVVSQNAAKASENEAASSKTAAANSAEDAANSQKAAAISESNAAASARAAAGSAAQIEGDTESAALSAKDAKEAATAAKNSEVTATESASAASASAKEAAASAEASAESQTAAKTSERNAESSRTAATNSAEAAANSQKAAAISESNAAASARAAAGSAAQIEGDTESAALSADEAKAAATAAKGSEEEAKKSASTASSSAQEAADSAESAATSQKEAAISESNAAASKTAADSSAAAAEASQQAAGTSERNAEASKNAAADSASAAENSATNAANSASAAEASAKTAKESEKTSLSNAENAEEAAKRAEDAAASAGSIAQGQKGYFSTTEALRQANPEGNVGDWAIVGSTDSIWVWDADTGAWVDTHKSVDLSGYYTKDQSDERFAQKTHTHSQKQVDGLQEALNGKASSVHEHEEATTSSAGFFSAADKAKLNGIETGANKTVVDSVLSSSSTNPVQNKVVNTALAGKADGNHSHTQATIETAGFMSSADKAKLNGIETGANKTVVDSEISSSSTNPVQNKVIKTVLDRKAESNHTHKEFVFVYKALFAVDGWSGSGPCTQTAAVTPVDGGPPVTADTVLCSGFGVDDTMAASARMAETVAAVILSKAANKTFGAGTLTVTADRKPAVDAEVYFMAKKGGQ